MVAEETVEEPPHEVIEAVAGRARSYRKSYEMWTDLAAKAQANAQESFDNASAHREKAEACEKWLDERAPGWRGEDDEDFTEEELEEARQKLIG